MDYTEQFKYCVFRIFLLFGAEALGLIIGKGVFWAAASVMTFLPEGAKQALVSDPVGSVTAAVIMAALLGLVFKDDGKKHAAYADMDIILVMITLILMLACYFIPVIFFDPVDSTRVVRSVYYMLYYPCRWVIELFGAQLKPAVAVGTAAILGIQLVIYNVSYGRYKVKHPFVFRMTEEDGENASEDAETSEGGEA